MSKITMNNIEIEIQEPTDVSNFNWIGQKEYQDDLKVSFMTLSETEYAMTPKIKGKPGVGKTTLVGAYAKADNAPLYIMQCSSDTKPEDLLVTPVISSNKEIKYVASPLLSAVINGGILILDEAYRMPEKSWASLASLFDDRRSVYSLITGLTFKAHKDFKCAITVNSDTSVYDIPEYIDNRIAPIINIDFPDKADEAKILQYHLPNIDQKVIDICVTYMQELHEYSLPYSIRDAVNALRLLGKTLNGDENINQLEYLFYKSFSKVIGKSIKQVKEEIEDSKLNIFDNYSSIASEFFDEDDNDFFSDSVDDDE